MFCSNCGASIAENAPFCSTCGRPAQNLLQNAPPPPSATGYAGPQQTDGKATGSLLLGILSFLGFFILAAIPAIVLGHLSRKDIRESRGRLKGDGMALAGLIMGYINVAFIPVILIIAAIAIPNLRRARMAANESFAITTLRTINTSQVTYSTTYGKSYAMDLATLGPGPGGACKEGTAESACLLDDRVANSQCTAGTWCTKGGFKYSMTGFCNLDKVCSNYVVVATPVSSGAGAKSFCSVSDAIIRSKKGVLSEPLSTVDECKAWPPL